jgi:hypothetical protein
VIQLSPPLIAKSEELHEIEGILRTVLTEASDRVAGGEAGGGRQTAATPRG